MCLKRRIYYFMFFMGLNKRHSVHPGDILKTYINQWTHEV